MVVGGFTARVIAADSRVSSRSPRCGTHVSGGAAIWILGDHST
jgi:hypothetical protein